MITRRLALAVSAVLLLAAPAAAQSDETAVSRAMIATVDLCLSVLKGQANWQTGLNGLGYTTTSSGGRVKPVGSMVIASTMGSNTMRGATVKMCEITASPQISDKSQLNSALRARAAGLPPMGSGPIEGGGVMDGYANLSGTGLIVLAITDRPGANGGRATTSLSVIWK